MRQGAAGRVGAAVRSAGKGQQVHDVVASKGLLENNIKLGGAFVYMYAKFGGLSKPPSVIEKLPSQNVVCENALFAGYAKKWDVKL